VTDAIARIEKLLPALPAGSLLAAFLPEIPGAEPGNVLRRRAAVSSTLIAGLELARDGALALDQEVAWRPIRVRHRDDGHVPAEQAGL
jgi:segregation and condensation protein A